MKMLLKSRIFMFALGAFIFGSISVYAYTLNANEIQFTPNDSNWNVNNVSDAINNMYEKTKEFTGEFYLSGFDIMEPVRVGYFDINVNGYKKIKIDVNFTYEDPSAFDSYILVDGVKTNTITSTGSFDIDVTNNNVVRIYYYELYGYTYLKGTYTLSN